MVHVYQRAFWMGLSLVAQAGLVACGSDSGNASSESEVGGTRATADGSGATQATSVAVSGRGGAGSVSSKSSSARATGGVAAASASASGGLDSRSGTTASSRNASGGGRSVATTTAVTSSGSSGSGVGGSSDQASGGRANRGGSAAGGKTTGGSATSGKATGGSAPGNTASGGSAAGGETSGGGSTNPTTTGSTTIGPTATCGCTTSSGEYSGNDIKATIVVEKGQVFDGECKTFRADPSTLGAGDQSEGQKPVFRVNGGTLQNVILGKSAADGIHIYGDALLKNVHWLDIGEDALTVKAAANLTIDCGSSNLGEDKTFQVNAASTIVIRNFTAKNAGKFMRQNGDTTFKMSVTIDHCDISNMAECIYRTDSATSTVTMTNTRYTGIGDGLFIFGSNVVNGSSNQSTVSNNQRY